MGSARAWHAHRLSRMTLLVALGGLPFSACKRSHDDHEHQHAEQPAKVEPHVVEKAAAGSTAYSLALAPLTELKAAEPTTLELKVSGPDAKALGPVEVIHERRFHIIAVSRALEFFAHEHSDEADGRPLKVPFTFPRAGNYRVFVEFKPKGEAIQLLVHDLKVPGDAEAPPALAADDLSAPKVFSGFDVRLTQDKSRLTFAISRGDAPVKLEPYLGAFGHAVVLGNRAERFVHSHPEGEAEGGRATFNVAFPEAGLYKVFGEFKPNGTYIATDFVVSVSAQDLAPEDHAHHAH
jgi:hypothetical protein